MAQRGSSKWFSELHENFIARLYGARRSPSSGAYIADAGDARGKASLYECKHTGTFIKPAKSIRVSLADVEKIADEAYREGREPVVCLRIYNPNSFLADDAGFIDLTTRLTRDDRRRDG